MDKRHVGNEICARPHAILKITMKEIFENMKNLADEFITDAEEFVNKQKKHDNMKKHVKVTALTDKGTSIVSGWFADVNKGEES